MICKTRVRKRLIEKGWKLHPDVSPEAYFSPLESWFSLRWDYLENITSYLNNTNFQSLSELLRYELGAFDE
jgi:hypothetical protein